MTCQDQRERLALRLYGELEGREVDALEQHLRDCDACRAYADELGAGLGRLVRDGGDDLPEGWAGELRERVAAEPARRPRPSFAWVGVAAGFLLGVVSMTLWGEVGSGAGDATARVGTAPPMDQAAPERAAFGRATPPPLATTGVSDLARLRSYVGR